MRAQVHARNVYRWAGQMLLDAGGAGRLEARLATRRPTPRASWRDWSLDGELRADLLAGVRPGWPAHDRLQADPDRVLARLIDDRQLDLEGLITSRRPLAEVNEGFADMKAGRGIRTVITI